MICSHAVPLLWGAMAIKDSSHMRMANVKRVFRAKTAQSPDNDRLMPRKEL